MAVANHDRVHKMLVQVIHVLDDAVLERPAHADVIEHREVLHVLAQAYAAGMWADGDAELRGEQQHGQDLIDPAQPATIDLTEADRTGLHELLEQDAVVTLLSGRDTDRRDGPRDGGVTQHVVWAGRLLDPPGIEPRQLAHPGDV